jgi:hypothetical protein
MAPWAIFPRASSRSRTAPFWAVQSSKPSGSQTIAASSVRARSERQKCFAPSIIPSSSQRAATTRRPANEPRATASAAKSIAATPAFMSAAPRP